MTLRALDYRDCATHGHSLFRYSRCIHCEKAGEPAPKQTPLKEPIPAWMRKAIERMDTKQAPERTKAMKRMEKWRRERKTAAEERKARAERWFTPIGSGT